MVSTHLKNISQNGNLPQIGVKIKNLWNHHPDYFLKPPPWRSHFQRFDRLFWIRQVIQLVTFNTCRCFGVMYVSGAKEKTVWEPRDSDRFVFHLGKKDETTCIKLYKHIHAHLRLFIACKLRLKPSVKENKFKIQQGVCIQATWFSKGEQTRLCLKPPLGVCNSCSNFCNMVMPANHKGRSVRITFFTTCGILSLVYLWGRDPHVFFDCLLTCPTAKDPSLDVSLYHKNGEHHGTSQQFRAVFAESPALLQPEETIHHRIGKTKCALALNLDFLGIRNHPILRTNRAPNDSTMEVLTWKQIRESWIIHLASAWTTHLKNICQNGNLDQVGVKIKHVWVATIWVMNNLKVYLLRWHVDEHHVTLHLPATTCKCPAAGLKVWIRINSWVYEKTDVNKGIRYMK